MWRFGLKETGRYAAGLLGALLLAATVSAVGAKAGLLAAVLERLLALTRLDFGTSAMTAMPAVDEISKCLPATLELVGGGAVIAIVVGAPFGLLLSWGRALRAAAPLIQIVAAAPAFCAGLALLWLAHRFHWDVSAQRGLLLWPALLRGDAAGIVAALPAFGLPVLVVGAAGAASVQLAVRRSARDAGQEPYHEGLRLMGLGSFEIDCLYMAPRVLAGVLASSGEIALSLFSATAVAEWVFGWPGAAILFVRSVALHDWNVAALILFAFAAIALTAASIGALAAYALGGPDA
jgi:peptide/nickel transport system permease protein